MMKNLKNTDFPYDLDFSQIDFRKTPSLYKVGKGEQGVLLVEPYKTEILPFWRFKSPDIAKESSKKIYQMFLAYKKQKDFVGMDMARKFLQMGYTRSRRYANHASGKKYAQNPQLEPSTEKAKQARKNILPLEPDFLTNDKAQSARIFYEMYKKANTDKEYVKLKEEWISGTKDI